MTSQTTWGTPPTEELPSKATRGTAVVCAEEVTVAEAEGGMAEETTA